MSEKSARIHLEVRQRYGRLAEQVQEQETAGCCGGTSTACCTGSVPLYEQDTSWLPATVSDLSLGCGDPLTLSQLQPGQTVLDLGSGGGIDCFMAARAVGETGRVIGVDMTPAMIALANENKVKVGLDNVSFHLGQIESLPVESAAVDVIISNCVVNLSPDKTAVFREAFRVLKPGGRLAFSDMMTEGRFSDEERADMDAWAECVVGAESVGDYVAAISAAGFENVSLRDKGQPEVELADGREWDGPARLFSAQITAVKPATLGTR